MHRYVALIRKQRNSCFGVEFPDFPGCISAGDTLEEAVGNAREALALHLEGLREDGETLPEPITLDDLFAQRAHRDALAVLLELGPPGANPRRGATASNEQETGRG